ncbi:MAG: DNA alkylation repair protein [Candidatus Aminicenantes bacterium]|nr:MAG: DNA alkylation repair protein [Candidatus Aminicenantes bacterium]
MSEILAADLHQAIKDATGRHHPVPDRHFHKHDEYLSYGLKASDFREIIKEFHPQFLKLSFQEKMDLAARFLQERVGELGHVGLYIITLCVKELTPEHFSYLDGLPEFFRSWSHVDHLSLGVMQPLLLRYRKETLELLEEWSRSPIRWKRRASVVAFVRKVAESGEFTREVIHLCENLIWDEVDIVQKGVGWALKDNLRSAPDRILPYIKDLRRRGVSSTITLYAIRDLKGVNRLEVLAVKKNTTT